jgi:hypothetical protein
MSPIEITQIIFQILFIFFVFSCTSLLYENNKTLKKGIFNDLDNIVINFIILINILIFTSILNINQKYILIVYIIIFFLSFGSKLFKENLRRTYVCPSFVICFVTIFLLSIDLAHELYLGWDAQGHYFFKTLIFFENNKFENLLKFPVPDYPHLGSYIWSFFWKFPFNEYEYMGRISYICIYILSIYSITQCINVNIYLKNIFFILIVLSTYKYNYFSGLQDNLIFSFMLIIASFYYRFVNTTNIKLKQNYFYIILGVINILFWIKNESLIYAFIFFLISIVLHFAYFKNKRIIFLIFASIILFRIIIFYYYDLYLYDEYQIKEISSLNFNITDYYIRFKLISYYLFFNLGRNPIYLVIFFCIFSIIYKFKSDKNIKLITIFLLFNIFFIYFAYAHEIGGIENTEYILKNSIGRLLHQTSGFYLLSVVIYINQILSTLKTRR